MPIPGLIAQGASQVLGSILGGIIGGGQKREGEKLIKSLQYPTESLTPELVQNQALAKEMASEGLPSEQYSQAMKNIQRNQLSAYKFAKDRRGGLGSLPGILQNTNDATLGLDTENAKLINQNKRNLISVNDRISSVKRDLFDKNKRDKYIRDYNYGMGLIGSGNQNISGALDNGIAGLGLTGYGIFGQNQSLPTGSAGGY